MHKLHMQVFHLQHFLIPRVIRHGVTDNNMLTAIHYHSSLISYNTKIYHTPHCRNGTAPTHYF